MRQHLEKRSGLYVERRGGLTEDGVDIAKVIGDGANCSSKQVGVPVGNQFSVQFDVVLAERHAESWDVERDVEDAEEDKAGGEGVQTASAADDLMNSGTGRGY